MTDSEEERVYNYYDPDHDPETQKLYIHWAINDDSLKTVKQLVEDGADVNVLQYFDCTCGNISCDPPMTPLMAAVQIGNTEIVSYLLQAVHDYYDPEHDPETRKLYIHWAVQDDSLKTVQRLAENGADLNVFQHFESDCGNISCDPPVTPLMTAVRRSNKEIVSYLLQAGADPLIVNEGRQCNALHYACEILNVDIIKLLLETTNIDINLPDDRGETPLKIVLFSLYGRFFDENLWLNLDIVDHLIEHGANVHHKNNSGENCIQSVAGYGNEELVQKLIKANADVNSVREYDKETPLIIAASNRSKEVILLLLKSGARIDAVDDNGNTAMHKAAKWKRTEAVKLLLEAKADINARNNSSKTPLMIAVNSKGIDDYYTKEEQMEVVCTLLEAGADIDLKDIDGKTAMDMYETEDIKNLLIYHSLK